MIVNILKILEGRLPPPASNRPPVPCYSSQLRHPTLKMPSSIVMEQSADYQWIKLKYKTDTIRFKATHFFKLVGYCVFLFRFSRDSLNGTMFLA